MQLVILEFVLEETAWEALLLRVRTIELWKLHSFFRNHWIPIGEVQTLSINSILQQYWDFWKLCDCCWMAELTSMQQLQKGLSVDVVPEWVRPPGRPRATPVRGILGTCSIP